MYCLDRSGRTLSAAQSMAHQSFRSSILDEKQKADPLSVTQWSGARGSTGEEGQGMFRKFLDVRACVNYGSPSETRGLEIADERCNPSLEPAGLSTWNSWPDVAGGTRGSRGVGRDNTIIDEMRAETRVLVEWFARVRRLMMSCYASLK